VTGTLRAATALLLASGLCGAPAGDLPAGRNGTGAEDPAPPNVLVFVTDDQRTDTMAAMPRTMAWFGRGGTRFTRAYATTPLCCPSRATIFTGRYAHNHGVRATEQALNMDPRSTVHRLLGDAGYLTAIAGKYLNEWPLERDPEQFDRWAIFNEFYEDEPFNVDGTVTSETGYSTDFVADRAVEYLRWFERDDEAPWLLYVTPFAPHVPFDPAPRHRDAPVPGWSPNPATAEADLSDKPPFLPRRPLSRLSPTEVREGQLRALLSVDELVGRVGALLDRLGESGDTLALFLSDNGLFWGEHGLRAKSLPYDPAARVPLFARWPGHVDPGSVDDRLVANVDLAPTILEAAGVRPDPRFPLDGRSLLGSSSRDRLLMEYFEDPVIPFVPSWAATVESGSLYVEYYGSGGEVTFREFYRPDDRWQLTNVLADDHSGNDLPPTELRRLSARLARDRACVGAAGPRACP
jgi:arylsulfatase A-like enzyme